MELVFHDKDLVVVDDFLDNPDIVRQLGVSGNYQDHFGQDGETYKRVMPIHIPAIEHKLAFIMGRDIELLGMAFRLNYEGELPNNEIHADLGWGKYAAVLYLSEPPEGKESGTAFWRHHTGAERIRPGEISTYEAVKNDWNDVSKWEEVRHVSAKYNSCIIYKSELFHSRWPFEAFGTTPEDGRLIIVVFFS